MLVENLIRCLFITFVWFFYSQNYSQEKPVNSFHSFSDAVVFTAEFGGTFPYTDYSNSDLDISGRGSIEYYFSSNSNHTFGVKFLSGSGFLSGEGEINFRKGNYRTGYFFIGGGIVYALQTGNSVPYLSANVAYLGFDPRNKNGNILPNIRQMKYDPNAILYSCELGTRIPFEEIISLNIGISFNYTNTDFIDDVEKSLNKDFFITATIGFSLFVGADKDKDEDGIEDKMDLCPGTQKGVLVDEFGCPLDSDSDGIPDYLDECPDTQKDLVVDEKGCSSEQQLVIDTKILLEEYDASTGNDTLETVQGYIRYDQMNETVIDDIYYTDGKIYCFQLGLFENRDAAVEKTNTLRNKGYSVFITKVKPFNDENVWFSVRIGYFNSLNDASNYKEKYFK